MLRLRKMTVSDIPVILSLEKQLFTSCWKEEDFIYEIEVNPYAVNYILEDDQCVLGYAGLWIMFEQAQITTIGIDPGYQRKGYASYLLNKMLEYVKEKECEVCTLEVRVSNHKAIGLYEKYGFKKEGIRKDYYQDNHEDAYLMVKRMEDEL